MMVSHPFTIVTPGKESIKAKVGQEHLKQQGFPWGKGGSVISPLTNMAKLCMSTPAGTVLSLIQGGICNPLHCIYTNSILTVQLNTDTSKNKKTIKFTSSQVNALSRYAQ